MLTHFLTFARVTNPPLLPPPLHLCSHTMFLSHIAISRQEISVFRCDGYARGWCTNNESQLATSSSNYSELERYVKTFQTSLHMHTHAHTHTVTHARTHTHTHTHTHTLTHKLYYIKYIVLINTHLMFVKL